MLLAVVYFVLRLALRIAPEGDARGREAEILVLRHQLAVMKRKAGRPKLRRFDRMLLAAFARLVPRDRWSSFVVSPQTILRWHRELVARKWTFRHTKTGRPPLDQELVVLIVATANDNPRLGGASASRVSFKASVTASERQRSGRSFAGRESHRLPGAMAYPGRSSYGSRPMASWPVTSSRSRRRSFEHFTSCYSWSSAHGVSIYKE